MVARTITRKKNPKEEEIVEEEIVEEELLTLLRESDTVEELEFNIRTIIDQGEAIDIIKHYEEIIKTENKKNNKI